MVSTPTVLELIDGIQVDLGLQERITRDLESRLISMKPLCDRQGRKIIGRQFGVFNKAEASYCVFRKLIMSYGHRRKRL